MAGVRKRFFTSAFAEATADKSFRMTEKVEIALHHTVQGCFGPVLSAESKNGASQ